MLNAIMCVWNEEDIIAANVSHALAQGCERVFIIDNGSTDRTVQQAVRAGAVYHASFETEVFDEAQKTLNLNRCVMELTKQLPDEFNWWLFLDADEFPDFDTGKSILEILSGLPQEVRAVGGYMWDHVPTHAPYNVQGFHPADFMPMVRPGKDKTWKFQLLRYDKGKPPLYSCSGAHRYHDNGNVVIESDLQMIIHHFNYRRPEVTKSRLTALVAPDIYGKRRVDWLDKNIPVAGEGRCFYHERFERMEEIYAHNKHGNLKTGELGYNFAGLRRWYDPLRIDMEAAVPDAIELHIWQGTQAYFLRDFETALFRFNDALELETDEYLKGLLLASMGRCYARLEDQTYLEIAGILRKSAFPEIKALAASLQG